MPKSDPEAPAVDVKNQDADLAAKAEKAPKDKAADEAEAQEDKPVLPQVSLDSFLRLCGERVDQMAGFAHFARRTIKGKMTMADWAAAFAEFNAKAVQ